jgi:hypothetical protein
MLRRTKCALSWSEMETPIPQGQARTRRSRSRPGVDGAAARSSTRELLRWLIGMQGMVTRTGWNGEVWGANQ